MYNYLHASKIYLIESIDGTRTRWAMNRARLTVLSPRTALSMNAARVTHSQLYEYLEMLAEVK